jgi:formate/nitrite transporter FocA (FNT family)
MPCTKPGNSSRESAGHDRRAAHDALVRVPGRLRQSSGGLLRGALAGGLLAYATSLVMVILSQGLPPLVGAICFPVGYEHAIVNMFVIPAGMALGAPVSFRGWWLWNQIPVTLGNMVGGAVLTGGALATCYPKPAASDVPDASDDRRAA